MTGYCMLSADINNCQYYDQKREGCNAPHTECGMFRTAEREEKRGYQRAERWYEKYYDNK